MSAQQSESVPGWVPLARLLTLIGRYANARTGDPADAIAARGLVRAEVHRWHAVIGEARAVVAGGVAASHLEAALARLDEGKDQ